MCRQPIIFLKKIIMNNVSSVVVDNMSLICLVLGNQSGRELICLVLGNQSGRELGRYILDQKIYFQLIFYIKTLEKHATNLTKPTFPLK